MKKELMNSEKKESKTSWSKHDNNTNPHLKNKIDIQSNTNSSLLRQSNKSCINSFKKETSSPVINKAREVIEDKRLFKLENYFIKTGLIKK